MTQRTTRAPSSDLGPLPVDVRRGAVPPPLVQAALKLPLTRHLLVTDAGYVRDVPGHVVDRPSGLPHTVVSVCASGRGWLRMGGEVHAVEPSTAMVIPAGMPHTHGTREPAWMVWWIALAGSAVDEILGMLGATAASPIIRVPGAARATTLIQEVMVGYERHPSLPRLIETSGIAWRLMSFLAVNRMRPEPRDPVVQAMRYVADHLDARIDVPAIAGRVGLSVSRLLARFQTATGGGIIAYQIQLRMAKAAQLLDHSAASIAEIARGVGYDDPQYFSRRFSATYGMSPTAFRARSER